MFVCVYWEEQNKKHTLLFTLKPSEPGPLDPTSRRGKFGLAGQTKPKLVWGVHRTPYHSPYPSTYTHRVGAYGTEAEQPMVGGAR